MSVTASILRDRHMRKLTLLIAPVVLLGAGLAQVSGSSQAAQERAAADLRARIEASPKLAFHAVRLAAQPPVAEWESGAVSGVAVGKNGSIYEIQRGEKSAPILVLDRTGHVLHSWGKGNYTIPHSIRLDPEGNVWTVDAASSAIIKYSPAGQQLMTIHIGGQ